MLKKDKKIIAELRSAIIVNKGVLLFALCLYSKNLSFHLSKLFQDVMMPNVCEDNYFIASIAPNEADIHIDAGFKQIARALYALCPQRRVHRVFS